MSEVKVNKISPRTNCGTVTVGDSGDSVSVSAGVPVTVNGDLKSNALKATDGGSIISQCGTAITIGASGDTVSLASGASQSGFGRSGTVDWQTTVKTSGFTAVSGEGYFCNTTSAAFTVTLPASPSAGDIVSIKDYANTFDTNNLTIGRNSSNIGGNADDSIISEEGIALTLVYADATKGWLVTESGLQSEAPGPTYIVATGGSIVTCGDYKVHTFTGPGTFTVCSIGNPAGGPNNVSYMVVAGGGGGGRGSNNGAGGGAGGFREGKDTPSPHTASPLATTGIPVTAQSYPITVGAGANTTNSTGQGGDGSNSVFSTITSTGGGGGGRYPGSAGRPGGSGGGEGQCAGFGNGNTPPVSPPQGQPGGSSCTSTPSNGQGAGGGAGQVGQDGLSNAGGDGGDGVGTAIGTPSGTPGPSPSLKYFSGGGAGGMNAGVSSGAGGYGGGGNGPTGNAPGGAGTTNSGGGGGGNGHLNGVGGAGGSGIVVIRYKFQ